MNTTPCFLTKLMLPTTIWLALSCTLSLGVSTSLVFTNSALAGEEKKEEKKELKLPKKEESDDF